MGKTHTEDRYISEIFDDDFVNELVCEFKLNAARLKEALEIAEDNHLLQQQSDAGIDQHKDHTETLKPLLTSLKTALKKWNALSEEAIKDIEEFSLITKGKQISTSDTHDQITQLKNLIEDFSKFFKQGKGNPGKTRGENSISLSPLIGFARDLNKLWLEEKGKPLKENFLQSFDEETDDPDTGTLTPDNEASEFFCKCAQKLDNRYTSTHCRTALRNI